MEGTHEVGSRPFMPDSTLNRRSVALYVAKPNPISYPQKTAECPEDWLIEGNVATGVNPDGTGPGNNSIGIKIDPPDKFTGIVRRLSINNNHVHDFQYAGIQVVPRVVNFAMRGNLVEGAEGILIISQAFGDRQPML
jgi:hypothetical protein